MLLLLGCQPDDVPGGEDPAFVAPDAPGPYAAGVLTHTWVDARGVAMTAEVWYPAEAEGEPEPYPEIAFPSDAYREAPSVEGEFPLVAFSHGNGGIRYQSPFFTEWLATHGFVVVSPDHRYNTALDFDENRFAEVAAARPGDVSSAVDAVLAGIEGVPAAQPDRFGMSGHSFGGWTTVAVAGGVVDFAAMAEFCAADGSYDLCNLGDLSGVEVPGAPDPRAVAAMPMAPAGWYSFGDLSGVAPSLVMGGSRDEGESVEAEIQPLYDRVPAPRRMGVLEGAGHYVYSDACAVLPIYDECVGPEGGYIDVDVAHGIVRALGVAFFQVTMNGDERYAEWLAGRWPELTWAEDPG